MKTLLILLALSGTLFAYPPPDSPYPSQNQNQWSQYNQNNYYLPYTPYQPDNGPMRGPNSLQGKFYPQNPRYR